MTKAQIEARRAYQRKWAHEHPESIARSQEKFWTKQARIMAEAAAKEAAEARIKKGDAKNGTENGNGI